MANQPTIPSDTPADTSVSLSPRRTWLWLLGILAAFGFLSLLACAGFVFLSWGKFSEVVGRQVVDQIDEHPVLVHRVGSIRSARMDWNAAMQDAKENPGKSRGIVVLEGSKANAKLAFEVGSEERPASAELIMEDGTRILLDLDEDRWPAIEAELKSSEVEPDSELPKSDLPVTENGPVTENESMTENGPEVLSTQENETSDESSEESGE